MPNLKSAAKDSLRHLPLPLRQRVCILLNRCRPLSQATRYWWTQELLRDFAKRDRDGYHRFLWSNHLGYSLSYEISQRFGEENMVASRRIFMADLRQQLDRMGLVPDKDVRSVFEVGCSLGYQLRYLETDLFTAATDIAGVDIDRYAIENGQQHLKAAGSKVRLFCEDLDQLPELLKGRSYDIIVCTGVLMYLSEADAARTLAVILDHSRLLAALSDPGHPETDNRQLRHSVIRPHDGSRFHNLDAMVHAAGGEVLFRRWEGGCLVDGQRVYSVFAKQ